MIDISWQAQKKAHHQKGNALVCMSSNFLSCEGSVVRVSYSKTLRALPTLINASMPRSSWAVV